MSQVLNLHFQEPAFGLQIARLKVISKAIIFRCMFKIPSFDLLSALKYGDPQGTSVILSYES